MSEDTITITNPVDFMDKSFMDSIMKTLGYKKETYTLKIIKKYQMTKEIVIKFTKPTETNNFINKYNQRFFDDSANIKLNIEKKDSNEKDEINPNKEMTYNKDYPNLVDTKYEKNPKYEGLLLQDPSIAERHKKVISWLIKKIGSNLIKGQSVMNISLPVYIFDGRTMLEIFAYELKQSPIFLSRAYYSTSQMEKLKWVTTFLLSQLYLSALQTKPFNPIIGETFQTKIGSMNVYCELIVNKPPTCSFYCIDDNKTYKFYGYVGTVASTGANSCKATKRGKIILEFKDGSKYRIYYPNIYLSGVNVGNKLFNYKHVALVVDEINQYVSYVKFNPDDKKSGIFSMFGSKKEKKNPDFFIGDILKLSDVKIDNEGAKHEREKKATSFCSISGEWSSFISFDNEVYWIRNNEDLMSLYFMDFTLPSDSTFREDVKLFKEGKESEAQTIKENYEQVQRDDRKLREKYKNK